MAEFKTYNTETIDAKIKAKQDTLASGTNIKTINNQSILGSGNLTISTTAASIQLYKHDLICAAKQIDSEDTFIFFSFSIINNSSVLITPDNWSSYFGNNHYYSVSGFRSDLEQFIAIQYLGEKNLIIGLTISYNNNSYNADMEEGYIYQLTYIIDSVTKIDN